MTSRCPDEAVLGQALSTGDARWDDHVAECAACATVVAEIRALVQLGRELPAGASSPGEREELRTALLAMAAREPAPPGRSHRRWPVVIFGTVAAAAAVVLALWAWRGERAPAVVAPVEVVVAPLPPPGPAPIVTPLVVAPEGRTRGSLHSSGAVAFTRVSLQPDEVVRLTQGRLAIDVTPLQPGERFRVIVGDSEIEVRGTSFVVEAKDDRLVRVAVDHGRVEVRRQHEPVATLMAHDVWERGDLPVHHVAVPAPVVAPAPVAPIAPTVAPPPRRSPAEAEFDRGWELLRKQDFAAAADAFSGALDPSRSSVAEDAAFWRSVALARAGRPTEARAAWDEFVAHFPASARRGEAEVALGWLALDAGHFDEATQHFAAAEHDRSPRVAAAARAGESAVAQHVATSDSKPTQK